MFPKRNQAVSVEGFMFLTVLFIFAFAFLKDVFISSNLNKLDL